MSDLPITGGCHCGAVRWEARAEPIAVRACWCGFCQALAAGSATVNLFFPTDAVSISGAPTTYVRTADSGNTLSSAFCPTCGTDVWTQAASRPHLIGLRAGTLDRLGAHAPTSTIWTAAAPAWARIDPDLPATERQPAPLG